MKFKLGNYVSVIGINTRNESIQSRGYGAITPIVCSHVSTN